MTSYIRASTLKDITARRVTATATQNFKWAKYYPYLFYLGSKIYESWGRRVTIFIMAVDPKDTYSNDAARGNRDIYDDFKFKKLFSLFVTPDWHNMLDQKSLLQQGFFNGNIIYMIQGVKKCRMLTFFNTLMLAEWLWQMDVHFAYLWIIWQTGVDMQYYYLAIDLYH